MHSSSSYTLRRWIAGFLLLIASVPAHAEHPLQEAGRAFSDGNIGKGILLFVAFVLAAKILTRLTKDK